MDHIKKIELVFENCEVVAIEPKYFEQFIVDGIKSHIYRCALNCIGKSTCSDHIAFCLLREGNREYDIFDMDDSKTTIFERIQNKDITSICITYDDDHEEQIYVDWNEDDDYTNNYQKVKITALGDLLCVIDRDKDIKDYFSIERYDDEDEMELAHTEGGWYEND